MLTKTNTPSLENFWMPFTANRQFKAAPRLLASASGMYYTDTDGNQVLDGTAGLWCCNAGHGRKRITEAVERQISTMDFAPTFQMGHNVAFDFAEKLSAIAPGGPDAKLDRVFFTNSGSESVDTALKIAIAYPARHRRYPHHGHGPRKGAITALVSAAFPSAASSTTAASSRRFLPTICVIRSISRRTPSPRACLQTASNLPTIWNVSSSCMALKRSLRLSLNRCRFGWRHPATEGLSGTPPRYGRQAWHPPDLRRSHHRFRPPRHAVCR